ncbi:hypothetical protein [Rhizobacter sp. OV335]|jgi:hypothetical protein|uniref:hypothetical protein n=1 Tax=Rhizobacter sp. OV335 TaxID=1500264 RepID=UPI00091F0377|nr:hypothetical protein [Rhizobacter sp. OV335]SHM60305.1 hypothetical protein SAMN02787076_01670 [Rhizobacter sp. OV335]
MNTPSSTNKYGIAIIKRASKTRPKPVDVPDDAKRQQVMESAKKVIAEHRDVIKALANR